MNNDDPAWVADVRTAGSYPATGVMSPSTWVMQLVAFRASGQ